MTANTAKSESYNRETPGAVPNLPELSGDIIPVTGASKRPQSNGLTGWETLVKSFKSYPPLRRPVLYALVAKSTFLYVGQTTTPRQRFTSHNTATSHLGARIAGAEFVVLRTCEASEANRLERQIIVALWKRGQCSLNHREPGIAPALATVHFDWQGRSYRLFKRTADKAAPWYFQIKKAGKRHASSTKTAVASVAIAKAKALLEASQRGELAAVRAILNPRNTQAAFCTVGELLAVFDKTVLDIGAKHRTGISSAISVVLRAATGASDLDKLSTWILNADTGRRYFEACLVKAQAQPSQEESGRVKRSANSTWCQAVCLLTPKLLAAYQRAGLQLPDLKPFLAVFDEEKFTKCTTNYNPPSDEVIRKTLRTWCQLLPAVGPYRIEERNMFLAIGLELACGLRRSEAAQVTWSMFSSRHGAPLLDGNMTVKNQTGRLTVQPIDPFWTILQKRIKREGWRGAGGELVLVGGKTELAEDIWRDVGAWLRGLGWKTEKTNHALRAFAGCQVAMKYDTYRAQCWLRHRSVTTTQADYGHFLRSAVFTPDKVRIRWAR